METLLLILFLFYCPYTNGKEIEETWFEARDEPRNWDSRVLECVSEVMYETAETPIRGFEKDICEAYVETDIDWRLVLAIGTVESNLCKNTNFQYNCWSIDVYNRKYTDYSGSIRDAFELLERYRDVYKLETVEEIGRTYCPNTLEHPTQADKRKLFQSSGDLD